MHTNKAQINDKYFLSDKHIYIFYTTILEFK